MKTHQCIRVEQTRKLTLFLSSVTFIVCVVFFFNILSPFAMGAYSPVQGWMPPWAGAETAYGINSRLGRAGHP